MAVARQSIDFLSRSLTPALRTRFKMMEEQLKVELSWEQAAADRSRSAMRKEHAKLSSRFADADRLQRNLKDLEELLAIAEAEKDNELQNACAQDLDKLAAEARSAEMEALLSGPADSSNCFVEISAGLGGTEAMSWVEMLYRMYDKWSEDQGFTCVETDCTPGPEAGFRQVGFRLLGPNAYGFMRSEAGTMRLIRNSPYDKQSRRQTCFAQVGVFPMASHDDDTTDVELKESDLKVDTFRSSGPGGQSVNTTSSAIRITHLPTGIVVQSQNERSQLQNRNWAMAALRARLLERKLKEKSEGMSAAREALGEATWGTQIRTVTLNPQQMVKDHRTDKEIFDADGYLEGRYLTDFMEDYLRKEAMSKMV